MHNLGDDMELDRLSREAAGEYNFPGEANWQALSEELDKVMPVEDKKRRILFFWWLLPLLLIGGGISYWLMMPDQQLVPGKTAIHATSATIPASHLPETAVAEQPSSSKTISTGNSVKEAISKVQILKLTKPADQTNAGNPLSGKNSSVKPTSLLPGSKQTNFSAAIGNLSPGKAKTLLPALEHPVQDASLNNNGSLPAGKEAAEATAKTGQDYDTVAMASHTIAIDPGIATNSNTQKIKEKSITIEEVQSQSTTAVTDMKKAVAATQKNNGFSFALLAGADKSTVKFKYGSDAGYNVGIMGGYHLNNRWSLHTGAIYTQKKYKVAGEDFTAPKGSLISLYKLEDIDGNCSMWEIPLLVRYTLPSAGRNHFFFSTGLSSYFMKGEAYDYFYYYNGQPVTRHGEPASNQSYLFSIVHLSAGFEKQFGKNWSFQVEPYAKIPMAGVGFGSIRLSSFGINFSVQHRQLSKK